MTTAGSHFLPQGPAGGTEQFLRLKRWEGSSSTSVACNLVVVQWASNLTTFSLEWASWPFSTWAHCYTNEMKVSRPPHNWNYCWHQIKTAQWWLIKLSLTWPTAQPTVAIINWAPYYIKPSLLWPSSQKLNPPSSEWSGAPLVFALECQLFCVIAPPSLHSTVLPTPAEVMYKKLHQIWL